MFTSSCRSLRATPQGSYLTAACRYLNVVDLIKLVVDPVSDKFSPSLKREMLPAQLESRVLSIGNIGACLCTTSLSQFGQ